jgi:pimeloyl-ACP methyl ester carboxylesterase
MPDAAVTGVRLYYGEHGTGDPILCIHGTSGSAMTWVGAREALSKLERVILYDRCASARSEATGLAVRAP